MHSIRQPSAVQKGCPFLGSAKSRHIFPFLLPRELRWKSLSHLTCFFSPGEHYAVDFLTPQNVILLWQWVHQTKPSGFFLRSLQHLFEWSSCNFLQERTADVLSVHTKVFGYLKDKFTDVQSVLCCYNVDILYLWRKITHCSYIYINKCIIFLHFTWLICQQRSAGLVNTLFWVIQGVY